jgi:hypothetical protein
MQIINMDENHPSFHLNLYLIFNFFKALMYGKKLGKLLKQPLKFGKCKIRVRFSNQILIFTSV